MQWMQSWLAHRTARVSASLTRPSNADAYAAGDVIAAVTTDDHFTFSGMGRDGKDLRSGSIDAAVLISSANQTTKLDGELWIFDTDIAEVGDNAAFAPTDAELDNLIGVIDFGVDDWKEGDATSGADGNAVNAKTGIQLPFKAKDKNRELFGVLVARNAYTPVSAEEFTVILTISKD